MDGRRSRRCDEYLWSRSTGFWSRVRESRLPTRVLNEDKSLRYWSTTDTDDGSQRGGTAGVASGEYSYAPGGYLIKLRYLDEDGQSTISDRGHQGFRRVYSEMGNRLEFFFIDERENRWKPPARGYAGQVFTWSADGRVRIRADRVGAGREIMDDPRSGYATVLYEFDETLRLVAETYYLADGSLCVVACPRSQYQGL